MKQDLLTKGFSLPTSEYLLFICFQIYLVHVLGMTGNMSVAASYTHVLIHESSRALTSEKLRHCQTSKK